jgi:predicted MFS family arabinose efflux permease
MLAMVAFGCGEVIGCVIIGQVIDRLGSRIAALFNVAIIIIMTIVTIAFLMVLDFGNLAYATTFMWGI